jgi:hypothetical protein
LRGDESRRAVVCGGVAIIVFDGTSCFRPEEEANAEEEEEEGWGNAFIPGQYFVQMIVANNNAHLLAIENLEVMPMINYEYYCLNSLGLEP